MNHQFYMRRCFALAKKGAGSVSPNPMVGCVIVHNDRIIGEGWHQQYGRNHAEVNAILAVKPEDKQNLSSSTLYVNLEPCNHFGNTPPCVNAILEHQILKVVICNIDSNPKVGGSGIENLEKNGVAVEIKILEKEGRELNKRFFTMMEKQRPYIILKWAQSSDGFFAKNDGKQSWITNEISRRIVHKWRSEEDAILIGKNTFIIDQPKLNNRYFEQVKQPTRIVISEDVLENSELYIQEENQTTIFVNSSIEKQENAMQFWQFDFDNNLIINLLKRLNKHSIQSMTIEGGAHTLQQFIDQNHWDEARVLTGKVTFEEGIESPTFNGQVMKQNSFGGDSITTYLNR